MLTLHRLARALSLACLFALAACVPAQAQYARVFTDCTIPAPISNFRDPVTLIVNQFNKLCTDAVGGGGGGGQTGSVTAAGTNGTQAQAVQGINNGVPVPIMGGFPSGAADSGNPVKIGGVYKAAPGTFADGQRVDGLFGQYGQQFMTLYDSITATPARVLPVTSDNNPANQSGPLVNARNLYFDGTTFARAYSAGAAARGAGIGIGASNPVPTTADVGITQAFNNGSTNALSAKASAGNLYGFGGTMGGTAGFLALVDAAAAPAAGAAISPRECITMAAGASFRSTPQIIPYRYTAGIQVLATTSCSTFTAPANAAVNLNAAVQ